MLQISNLKSKLLWVSINWSPKVKGIRDTPRNPLKYHNLTQTPRFRRRGRLLVVDSKLGGAAEVIPAAKTAASDCWRETHKEREGAVRERERSREKAGGSRRTSGRWWANGGSRVGEGRTLTRTERRLGSLLLSSAWMRVQGRGWVV